MRLAMVLIEFLLVVGAFCSAQTSSAAPAIQTSQVKPEFSISATGPTGPIKVGTPINITVIVTNITKGDIYWISDIGENSPYKAFRVAVTKAGREVDTTFFHRKITGRQRRDDPAEVSSGSSIAIAHPPGNIFEIPINLDRLYKITEPGVYMVEVSRYDETTKLTVRTSPLALKIVP